MNENQLKELDRTMSWLDMRITMRGSERDYIRFAMAKYTKKFNDLK